MHATRYTGLEPACPCDLKQVSEAAVLQLLDACPDLLSLRLRHCCKVGCVPVLPERAT